MAQSHATWSNRPLDVRGGCFPKTVRDRLNARYVRAAIIIPGPKSAEELVATFGKQHAGRPGRGKRAPAAGKGIAYASSASAASASSLGCHNDQRLHLTEHPRGWWHKAAESIAVRPLWTEAYGWLANTAGVANPRENERHARASQLATHFHAPAGERRRWYHGPVLLQLLQKHVCHQRP